MRNMPSLSLRMAMRVVAVSVIAMTLLLAVLLSVMTTSLHRSMSSVSRALEGARIAGELQAELLNQVRLGVLAMGLDSDRYDTLRSESRSRMETLLTSASEHVGSPAEQELLDRIRQELGTYFVERARTDRASLVEMLEWSTPRLDPILGSVEELQALNAEQATLAADHATWLNERADLLGMVIFGAVLVAGLLLSILGHRHVYRPLKRLADSIHRFSQGDAQVRGEEWGPEEVREVARAFNALSEDLARRRETRHHSMAGIVHDLKNPLAGSRMLLPVLGRAIEAGDVSSARRISHLLDRQLGDMGLLAGDLLDLALMEEGRLSMNLEVVDLAVLLRDVAEGASKSGAARAIEMSVPDEAVPLMGDRTRLSQVFRNLLDNAIKYSPQGRPVAVTLEAGASTVQVTVADQGIGIHPHEMPSLFQPFWRSEEARRSAPGTGVGLSIVQKIVSAHGGHIGVESRPGEGTRFRVTLPCAQRAVATQATTLH